MACTEFVNAINWSKQSKPGGTDYPVKAYFTKHFGYGEVPVPEHIDAVHYASGSVTAVVSPKPHLKGTLKVAKNTTQDGGMISAPALTYDVEIDPDGTLSYLMKLNGQAVGGMPPTKVQATCVNNVLLTATSGSQVVTVGVAKQPKQEVPS